MPERKSNKNVYASIKQKLLNIAKTEHRDYQAVFKQYIQERMLYRISVSQYSKTFILKGALLFLIYNISYLRPTKDVDFMGKDIENDEEVLKNTFAEIAKIESDDGLIFDPDSIKTERITEDGNYKGVRVHIGVKLGSARDRLQIDIGFGDKIYKGPVEMEYPTLLDYPAPKILTYSIESSVAEKFEAIVSLGIATSRMKDFYDILFIAGRQKFEFKYLREALELTFGNRGTDTSDRSRIFENSFKADKGKQIQWGAFIKKNKVESKDTFESVVDKLKILIEPLFIGDEFNVWNPEKWTWE